MMVMMMDKRRLDEEYEVDSRRIAHTEECSGVEEKELFSFSHQLD